MITIERRSMLSGRTQSLTLPLTADVYEAALATYRAGALLQNAFPMLSAEEREFIKTGITPEEWASVFGPLDEEALA